LRTLAGEEEGGDWRVRSHRLAVQARSISMTSRPA